MLAEQIGFKPPVAQYLAASARIEYNERTKWDPVGATALEPCLRAIRRSHPSSVPRAQTRGFRIKHSRRAHDDPVEFFALYEVTELFNSGRALEPGSACFTDAVAKVAKRAIAARKGRKVGIREYNTVRNGVVREAHS